MAKWLSDTNAALALLCLYLMKDFVLRSVKHPGLAVLLFAGFAGLCVPATWPPPEEMNLRHFLPICFYVGNPVAILTVPSVSFLYDLVRRQCGAEGRWLWRVPLEVQFGLPAWGYVWAHTEWLVLGWVMI